MDARNRMADVKKLKANALQDYLRYIIIHDWQKPLYKIVQSKSAEGYPFRSNYRPTYRKMREIGIDNYTIDQMDVTIIYQILKYERSLRSEIDDRILKQLLYVKNGRNTGGHSSENEPDEDLYLFALLELVDLRYFVVYVDDYSKNTIDDSTRQKYVQEYTKRIDDLKHTLDDERIELVQRVKHMNTHIAEVLSSDNPLQEWVRVLDFYQSKQQFDRNWDEYMEFYLRASNEGIPFAHIQSASYLMHIKKDYEGAIRHLLMLPENYCIIDPDAKTILEIVNSYLRQEKQETDEIKKIIKYLDKFFVVQNTDGKYDIPIDPPIRSDNPCNNSMGRYIRRD